MLYVNKQTGEQQNDSPQLLEIMRVVREKHKSIKYITYRCATKIWFLKQSFYSKKHFELMHFSGFVECQLPWSIINCNFKCFFFFQILLAVNIPYNLVISVLNHHGFAQYDHVPTLKPTQLTALLHDIYYAAQKCDFFAQCADFHLERCTALLANFFWNIYDPWVAPYIT